MGSKRANAHRDWSHLALRKPATSRPVDGRNGGDRFSGAWQEKIIQTLPPPRCLRHRPPMQFKEGSLSPRWCGPTSHESLCQRWPPYLPSTGRLVAGFLRAKCHHLVGCQQRLVSSPNVTMDQRLFSLSQAAAMDKRPAKLFRSTNESLGDAPDIFFPRRSDHLVTPRTAPATESPAG